VDEAQKRGLLKRWSVKEKTFKRDVEEEAKPFISDKNAVFLYGPRRSGKSTVAKRIVWSWKNAKSVYLNLEDPALESELGTGLLDEFAQGLAPRDLLVIDEVQLVSGWEKWVRRAVDTRQCSVLVTGSSAKLLSGEFASSLGGRGVGFRVLPLSFREFVRVSKKGLEEYLRLGGYPEIVLNPDKKDRLLESYFELALMKDVVERYNVRNAGDLRTLAFYLLTNSGKLTSFKQVRAALGLSFDSIRNFTDYLETAFLIFQVPFFSYSMKESLAKPRKIIAWDNGMQDYASKSFSPDYGSKAEAAVAHELRRRGFELYYWRGKREVDFVARKKLGVTPVNVCYAAELTAREEEGLIEFCSEFKTREAIALYLGKTRTVEKEGMLLRLINLREWLLSKELD